MYLRVASSVVEEFDDGVGRSVATRVAGGRRDAVQRPLLQGAVGVEVDMGRPLLFVSQPQGDRGRVDPGVRQRRCGGYVNST